MADETSTSTDTAGAAGGAHGAAGKKAKGPAWLHGKHRTEILVIGGTAVLLLIALSLRGGKGASKAEAAAPTQQASTTARAQAGSIGQVAGSDINAVNGLQTLLANQSDQLSRLTSALTSSIGDETTPTSIASTLSSPTYAGQYVAYKDGYFEQQEDGSLLHLDMPQWLKVISTNGGVQPISADIKANAPVFWNTADNITNKAAAWKTTTTATT